MFLNNDYVLWQIELDLNSEKVALEMNTASGWACDLLVIIFFFLQI